MSLSPEVLEAIEESTKAYADALASLANVVRLLDGEELITEEHVKTALAWMKEAYDAQSGT